MSEKGNLFSKNKTIIIKAAIVIIAVLIVCTFASRSIYTILLPTVDAVEAEKKTLVTEMMMKGNVYFPEQDTIKAGADVEVIEVFVRAGDKVKKGDALLSVDTSEYDLQEKRLKLAVLQLEKGQKPSGISSKERKEIQLQLGIAKNEYELFLINSEIEASLKEDKYELEQAQLREQSAATQAQLKAAYAQWQKYWFESSGVDHAEELKLRQAIYTYERQLRSAGLSDEKRAEIEQRLYDARVELDAFIANYPEGYDYVQEQQSRVNLIMAQNSVLLLDESMSEDEKNSARLTYELAQDEYKNSQVASELQNEITKQKLLLDIQRYENVLADDKSSLKLGEETALALEIARQELEGFRATMPVEGIISATEDCEILNVFAAVSSTIESGKPIISYKAIGALPYVAWSASYEAGSKLSEKTAITATFYAQVSEKHTLTTQMIKTIKVDGKLYDKDTKSWHFTAQLSDKELMVQEGAEIDISMRNETNMYQVVIPTACLYEDSDGKYYVLIMAERSGLFSKESYAQKAEVKLLEKNNFFAAVEYAMLTNNDKFISYSSKPISSGDTVSIKANTDT